MSFNSQGNNFPKRKMLYSLHKFNLSFSVITIFLFLCFGSLSFAQTKWVGTWSTAPQLVETQNNPPPPGLSNNTIRQIMKVSLGGDTIRVRFSNEFSTSPVTINEAHIAVSTGLDTIITSTDKTIFFNGSTEVTMEPGAAITSDPLQFEFDPLTTLAITTYFGGTSATVTGHPGSRTTSYILTGNHISDENFLGAVATDHWYVINTIDVLAPDSAAALAIIGNSITDGRGSGTNKQNRWPDELSVRLQQNPNTKLTAVLNEGIGGNCVLQQCLGPSALSRFGRDVLQQSGIRWLIILEGINDIGGSQGSGVGNDLIDAFTQMIHSAHTNGIFVYGATLLPMKGSFYYTEAHEVERQIVNNWIRSSGKFDAVIDLDLAMRDPTDTLSMLPAYDTGDHLHPNEAGHHAMAEAVDLNLFVGRDSLVYNDESISIYFETECATVGEDWDILSDIQASNTHYVTVKPGLQSITNPPADSSGYVIIPFSVDSAGNYSVFGRMNCPTYDDDSYWVKMDEGEFQMYNGLVTSGWEWKKFDDYMLTEGEHTLTIGYREDGAELDKICVSNFPYAPLGMGAEAVNLCNITGVEYKSELPTGYELKQNYPNPFNPSTTLSFVIGHKSFVSLKVFDILGNEIAKIVNEEKPAGEYEAQLCLPNQTSRNTWHS